MLFTTAALGPLLLLVAAGPSAAVEAEGSHRQYPRRPQPRSYDTHTYYALELPESASEVTASRAAQQLGAELVEPLGELAGHWVLRRSGITARSAVGDSPADPVMARWDSMRSARTISRRSVGHETPRSLEMLVPRQRVKRVLDPELVNDPHARASAPRSFAQWEKPRDDAELLFLQNDLHMNDPILNQQWHFANPDSQEFELNITKLWKDGITGKGVHVAVVDDGLDLDHEDIAPNYFAAGSWDFNNPGPEPRPRLANDQHGTRCAGEIAAAVNDACGVGVAHEANIAGLRILSGQITDADEAAALNYGYQLNDIYSCSWGPPDDGRSMEAPDGVILKSMVNGVQKGRGGKGSVFVFAAGNGASAGDQCNFDGYTNSIFSVTVGAYDHLGHHPFYSEMCSAMMIVAPSSGSGNWIHTTDVGKGKCAHNHGGTSAAAPIAAGVFALALQARPELHWRDIQHIAVNNAVMINADDEDWSLTHTGRNYSYKYGFGRLDATKYVEAARTHNLVKPQAWFDSPAVILPDAGGPPPARPNVDSAEGNDNSERQADTPAGASTPSTPVAHGTFITHEGINSTFEVTQQMLDDNNFERMEHVTVRLWASHARRGDVEVHLTSPNGIVSTLAKSRQWDSATTGFKGWKFMTLKHWEENPVGTWTLTVRDKSDTNVERVGRFEKWALQLWGEVVDPAKARIWAPAMSGEADEEQTGSSAIPQKPKPTDLLPGDHGVATGTVRPSDAVDPQLSTSTTAEADEKTTTAANAAADEGIFEGIDALRSHSAWLGGAFLIVLLAALGTGGFFLLRQRRKRAHQSGFGLGASRSGYEPVADEEVSMGLLARGRRAMGGGGRNKRDEETKELYDAFGDGPSDDSEDDGEDTALRYHEDFLEDGDDDGATPHASGSGTQTREDDPPSYRDDAPGSPQGTGSSGELVPTAGESNTSSGSWQDAAEDVRH